MFIAPPKPFKVRKKESFSYSISGMEGESNVSISPKNAGKGPVFTGYYRFPEPTKSNPAITVTLDKAPQGITAASAGSLRFVGPFPTVPEKMPTIQGTTE